MSDLIMAYYKAGKLFLDDALALADEARSEGDEPQETHYKRLASTCFVDLIACSLVLFHEFPEAETGWLDELSTAWLPGAEPYAVVRVPAYGEDHYITAEPNTVHQRHYFRNMLLNRTVDVTAPNDVISLSQAIARELGNTR